MSYERGTPELALAREHGDDVAIRNVWSGPYFLTSMSWPLQGYLAHKEPAPPLGPPLGPMHIPTVGS